MPAPMTASPAPHLLIPHASAASEAGTAALKVVKLPNLAALLARLQPQEDASAPHEADEYSLSAPHERALAALHGWSGEDGRLPWAAAAAADDGLRAEHDTSGAPWGRLTPVHWHVGSDSVTLVDPAALELTEAESRALFEAVKPSFDAEGWTLLWGAPLRWHVRHEALAGLACASLDRAIGRNLDLWMSDAPEARRLRRMQVEAQMIWHDHPVNDARDASRRLLVNSFWLDGCGAAQPRRPLAEAGVQVDERLRAPLLAGDWAAWVAAWQTLDAGPVAALRARAEAGEAVTLTLCGERHARRFGLKPRGWLSRLMGTPRPADACALLATL